MINPVAVRRNFLLHAASKEARINFNAQHACLLDELLMRHSRGDTLFRFHYEDIMDVCFIKHRSTMAACLADFQAWGILEIHQKASNQYTDWVAEFAGSFLDSLCTGSEQAVNRQCTGSEQAVHEQPTGTPSPSRAHAEKEVSGYLPGEKEEPAAKRGAPARPPAHVHVRPPGACLEIAGLGYLTVPELLAWIASRHEVERACRAACRPHSLEDTVAALLEKRSGYPVRGGEPAAANLLPMMLADTATDMQVPGAGAVDYRRVSAAATPAALIPKSAYV